ncbi:hypothetical protein [Janibacter sp. GS2]|uniref:hypothetical protein n=1 Tax=Janibacter sp. GS2 TaxID=3442646 RepID=UPI003EBD49FC
MSSHSVRTVRRRTALVAAGAVVLSLSACGPVGGKDPGSSSSSYEPVITTSTTEPPTSSSTSATRGGPRPPAPDAATLVARAKQHMSSMSTVSITGTLYTTVGRETVPVELRSAGSTGDLTSQERHAGASKTTLTLPNGGTLEVQAQGWYHYIRADAKWFAGLGRDDTTLAKYAGEWLKVTRDDSPVDDLRPNSLVKGSFFGKSLTPFDGAKASGSTDRIDGEWVARIDLPTGRGQRASRVMWISLDPAEPEMLRLAYGQSPAQTVYDFSGWNDTNDQFTVPKGARTMTKERLEGIGVERDGVSRAS